MGVWQLKEHEKVCWQQGQAPAGANNKVGGRAGCSTVAGSRCTGLSLAAAAIGCSNAKRTAAGTVLVQPSNSWFCYAPTDYANVLSLEGMCMCWAAQCQALYTCRVMELLNALLDLELATTG
jgi:hypothetical protein